MTEPTRDEVIDALRRAVLDGHVRQHVLLQQLAAELYPEDLRVATSYVFDVSAVLDRLNSVATVQARIEAKLADVMDTQHMIDRESQERFDYAGWVLGRLTALENRVEAAARFVGKIYAALIRHGIIKEKANGKDRRPAVQRDPARKPGAS